VHLLGRSAAAAAAAAMIYAVYRALPDADSSQRRHATTSDRLDELTGLCP